MMNQRERTTKMRGNGSNDPNKTAIASTAERQNSKKFSPPSLLPIKA
jgi:hypothetical protein